MKYTRGGIKRDRKKVIKRVGIRKNKKQRLKKLPKENG